MRSVSKIISSCSIFAMLTVVANAAGTYYNGAYQSPQMRYSQPNYNMARQRQMGYGQNQGYYSRTQQGATYANARGAQRQMRETPQKANAVSSEKQGFYLDAGISRETSTWQFEMKSAGSELAYNNLDWYVFDVNAAYVFNAGSTPMQIDAGFKYGIQSGETSMVDDDISNGGYFVKEWLNLDGDWLGDQVGHAMSIGTSKGGNMMGFNIGFGLTDFFKWGNARITPSVGYRYLKYKLETEKNYGLAVDVVTTDAGCIEYNGEIQCDPAVIIYSLDANGDIYKQILLQREVADDGTVGLIPVQTVEGGQNYVSNEGTYYFQQSGVSHSYDVTWAGPYLALDIDYEINKNNSVNGRVEIGLPSYTAEGDQPYRYDWAHPKSVEDEAGIGSAFHFGLGANWSTAISDRVSLSIGLTYDYYSVGDADAKTYLNEEYYTGLYYDRLDIWEAAGFTETDMINGVEGVRNPDEIANAVLDTEEACPGWVCSEDGEIESFYKSMGIRVGLNAKF